VTTYLQRYDAGERLAVWQELHAFGPLRHHSQDVRDDVAAVAERTIGRAAENLRTILDRLSDLGYRFDPPEYLLVPVGGSRASAITSLLDRVGGLPPTLTAALHTIGDVSFRGWLPAHGSAASWQEQLLDPFEFVLDLQSDIEDFDYAATLDESDPQKQRGLRLTFSGDYLHKNNVSGGQPSQILLPADSADVALVEDDGATNKAFTDWLIAGRPYPQPEPPPQKPIWFVDYLRMYFSAGGFRRVAETASYPESFARALSEGLLDI
jgi:hypothetical protein